MTNLDSILKTRVESSLCDVKRMATIVSCRSTFSADATYTTHNYPPRQILNKYLAYLITNIFNLQVFSKII